MKSFFILFFVLVWTVPLAGAADVPSEKTKTITARHDIKLGKNDSMNDARHFCYIEARRKLIENVRHYLEKEAYGDDHWFDKKDVDTFAEPLLTIETAKEEWTFADNALHLTMAVQTTVDADYIGRRLPEIRADEELMKKIEETQAQRKRREDDYAAAYLKLTSTPKDAALPLRSERQTISREIDRLDEIKYIIGSKTRQAEDKVTPGMTMDEVVAVIGQPRATAVCEYPDFLNYGNTWIMLRDGIVVGKIPMEKWRGACRQYNGDETSGRPADRTAQKKTEVGPEKDKFRIILKSGKAIATPSYYQIDDVIYYKQFDGIIGVEAAKVESIEAIE